MDNPEYIVNHVFMPLQLPQHDEKEQDQQEKNLDQSLAQLVAKCARAYHGAAEGHAQSARWPAILRLLEGIAKVHTAQNYASVVVKERLKEMDSGDVAAFLVRQQNAGMIVRVLDEQVVFEVFEASAPTDVVMACENKLVWTFPGPSTSIPRSVFHNPHFQAELGNYLAEMNRDVLPGSAASSSKAGSTTHEIRDTAHPRYISDLLLVILAATGGPGNPIVESARRIEKRIADDVLWNNAKAPWRRSSLWLVIRVALQTTLEDRREYKAFMLYLMSTIALGIQRQDFNPSILDNMRKKLARRAQKLDALGGAEPSFVLEKVHLACSTLHSDLQSRWEQIQALDTRTYSLPWAPHELDIHADTYIRLTNATPYIEGALRKSPPSNAAPYFQPSHPTRINSHTLAAVVNDNSPLDSFVSGADAMLALADFEAMVRDQLPRWIEHHLGDAQAPSNLERLIKDYLNLADSRYRGNAEQQSVMILTALHLWAALDRVVIHQYPLLAEYPPDVPLALLEPLLLRRRSELERVKSLSEYIRGRWARGRGPSVFSPVSYSSIAVRGYDGDHSFETRRREIEEQARRRKSEKVDELRRLNKAYEELRIQRDGLEHDHSAWSGWGYNYCQKCGISARQKRMSNMTISLYEWPLPEDTLHLKHVIFECYCPKPFVAWREATYHILYEVFTSQSPNPTGVNAELGSFMSSHASGVSTNRITLGSEAKSWLRTHYASQSIPSTESDVCKPHGPSWFLYDSSRQVVIKVTAHSADVSARCILQLPSGGSHSKMQWAVDATTHTENQILARQHECPGDLSLHEFLAFAGVRSGGELQWMNIARVFAARSLSFRSQAVHVLLSQAAQQYGSMSDCDTPLWHLELASMEFGQALFSVMSGLLDSYRENWQEIVSVKTVVVVAVRMLASLGADDDRAAQARAILDQACGITDKWLCSMLENLEQTAQVDIESAKCNIREVAATCALTFDTSAPDLSPDKLALLLHSSLVLQNNREAQRDRTSSSTSRVLSDRVETMFHALESGILASILADPAGLDVAVGRVWREYERGTSWASMGSPNGRWMMCQTTTPQYVQVNLLDGTLLVDGRPIGNLPSSITEHRSYSRIFGKSVLRAIPAGEAGFDYKTVVDVSGHRIFFALQGSNLVVEARSTSGRRERYIPHTEFKGDLPIPLAGLVQWLDLDAKEVEFRPPSDLWTSSSKKWTLDFSSRVMSDCEGNRLLDIHSSSFDMMRQRLEPIESPAFLIATTQHNKVDIRLPRLQLDFQTALDRSARLWCLTFPDCFVDESASIGTLLGFQSKLVLREHSLTEAVAVLLIPFGRVTSQISADHVSVSLCAGSASDSVVKYTEYSVNAETGMLSGDGTLRSHLFRALLHARTSYPLPDPLTGHSGVEEALNILASASCMSFQTLDSAEQALLREISLMTPVRTFYPKGMKVMQTVQWSACIPPCTQLAAFGTLVKRILDYNNSLSLFYPGRSPVKSIFRDQLSCRATARERLYPLVNLRDMPPELNPSVTDGPYTSRVTQTNSKCDEHAYSAALMAFTLDTSPFPLRLSSLYNIFEGWDEVLLQETPSTVVRYSSTWLDSVGPAFNFHWAEVYRWCTNEAPPTLSVDERRFALLFSLPAFTFTDELHSNARLLPYLIRLVRHSQHIVFPALPDHSTFDLRVGVTPSSGSVDSLIAACVRSLGATPSRRLRLRDEETAWSWNQRCERHYSKQVEAKTATLRDHLISRWDPRIPPSFDLTSYTNYFEEEDIRRLACELFQKCRANIVLQTFAQGIDSALRHVSQGSPSLAVAQLSRPQNSGSGVEVHQTHPPTITLASLLRSRAAPAASGLEFEAPSALRDILRHMRDSRRPLHRLYAKKMLASLCDLERGRSTDSNVEIQSLMAMSDNFAQSRDMVVRWTGSLATILRPSSDIDRIMYCGGLWPSLSTRVLLSRLARTHWADTDDAWRRVLALYACLLLRMQQSRRLVALVSSKRKFELDRELGNCAPFDVGLILKHPDWALLQIEADFRARPIQIAVAEEMYSPTDGGNISLQLNMGEGKSSVIAPMLAAALSDGRKLVRMVVLKSLAPQMFQLLCARLSGLLNRQIFYLPFSRQLKVTGRQLKQIRALTQMCQRVGGVLVSQPEHILSARLLAVEKMLSGSDDDQDTMTEAVLFERDLHSHSCDILDECDELLHPRYQLIYTMGTQLAVEGHPVRWLIIQDVLSLVARHMRRFNASASAPGARFELHSESPWSFPQFKLPVTGDDRSSLLSALLEAIQSDVLESASLGGVSFRTRNVAPDCIRRFVTSAGTPDADSLRVEEEFGVGDSMNVLLILRGLFGHGLLSYVLCERRWRVDYGLDPSRTMLAVPYRAKDVPSLRAEFGHPDIAILLTCLAYYYTGLTSDQVDACLDRLFADSNPTVLYESWVKEIPRDELDGLTDFGSINRLDQAQRAKILRMFHRCRVVVDFYLSEVVFPKAAKEFPKKLPTSAWDLAERKHHLTTGFSGTNDNEHLLPTMISQVDPVNQGATNAMVLGYLLRPQNANYTCTYGTAGTSMTGEEFVTHLAFNCPEIRVFLDIGAQMLDMGNEDVAMMWLSKYDSVHVEAAVFFNASDELRVVKRDGTEELLQSSPYRQQLSRCLIYLDDAHTRGTDLKLPSDWRAAVTLGRKVTKDRLVQGCLRMRQLSVGQSLHFFAQPDVDDQIKKACNVKQISVADIIHWTMLETCADIEHHIQQWARQGPDFKRRRACLDAISDSVIPPSGDIEHVWLQPEARTLKEMYAASPAAVPEFASEATDTEIEERLERLGITISSSRDVDEEQEREVDHEMEIEREVFRPPPRSAATHVLDDDVRRFVQEGYIRPSSNSFHSPLRVLEPLRYSARHPGNLFHPTLLVTRDYACTTSLTVGADSLEFMKDVQWLLVGPSHVVIISQFEAGALLPLLRTLPETTSVRLHVYSPRVMHTMRNFDSLDFYSVPSASPTNVHGGGPVMQHLGVFAAQLYPPSFDTFKDVSTLLALDGDEAAFKNSSPFLQELFATRRKGQSYALTPMGKLLRKVEVLHDDF